jgi:hypothetical protein
VVEVAFESSYVCGPEPTERSEPGVDILKWFGFQAALCVHCGFNETGVSQMLWDGRLWHRELISNTDSTL